MEKQVSETILERPKQVQILHKLYQVAPPTLATLILFSEIISELPEKEINSVGDLLRQKQHLISIAKALSCLVLGAEKYASKSTEKKQIWSFFTRQNSNELTQGETLTQLLLNAEISEVLQLFTTLIGQMQIENFFVLTTSLIQMKMTKPTREVGN